MSFWCWHRWKKIEIVHGNMVSYFRRCPKCGAVQVRVHGPFHPEGWFPLYGTYEFTWPREMKKAQALWEEHIREKHRSREAREREDYEKYLYELLDDVIMAGEVE